MTLATLLLAAGWLLLVGLTLAVLRVARQADEASARQLTRGVLGVSLPAGLRRPLPLWTSLVAGLLAGAVAGVFAGSVIVNAVKPASHQPTPKPWIAPRPTSELSPPATGRQPAVRTPSSGGLAAPSDTGP